MFIIGNGFDLHHGIPSSCSQFDGYVERNAPRVFELINEYMSVDKDFWNCFEERLASLDEDSIIDHATNFLVSYGADDWSDADHHNFEYEIEQIVSGLSDKLRAQFGDWIRELPVPSGPAARKVRCIAPYARFLNFNYTPTLQQVYGVQPFNVLHIHGASSLLNSELVIGHGWERMEQETLSMHVNEDTDTRVAGGYQLIDSYFAATFKPTEELLSKHDSFFQGVGNVSKIWVLGHSIADVDAA